MIVAAALCPHPPLLFRELCGREDAVPGLREACRAGVAALARSRPDVVVVVGGAEDPGVWDGGLRFDVSRFGATPSRARSDAAPDLPLSLGVASRMLDESDWAGRRELVALRWDATRGEIAALAKSLAERSDRVALLVMAEGSARRGETAPGYVDDRAPGFDEDLVAALRTGDSGWLRAMDTRLAAELMVLGRSPFRLLGQVLPQGTTATMVYEDDPFGVLYLVASWVSGGV